MGLVQFAYPVVGLAPKPLDRPSTVAGGSAVHARVTVLITADQVPEGVTRERVRAHEHDVYQEYERADRNAERTAGEERQRSLVPQERDHDDRGIQEVAVYVVQHEQRRLTVVAFAGLLALCVLGAVRRVPEERAIVRLAIVIAGSPEPERDPEHQHRRGHEPRHPARNSNRRRVEGREQGSATPGEKEHYDQGVNTKQHQHRGDGDRPHPPGQLLRSSGDTRQTLLPFYPRA